MTAAFDPTCCSTPGAKADHRRQMFAQPFLDASEETDETARIAHLRTAAASATMLSNWGRRIMGAVGDSADYFILYIPARFSDRSTRAGDRFGNGRSSAGCARDPTIWWPSRAPGSVWRQERLAEEAAEIARSEGTTRAVDDGGHVARMDVISNSRQRVQRFRRSLKVRSDQAKRSRRWRFRREQDSEPLPVIETAPRTLQVIPGERRNGRVNRPGSFRFDRPESSRFPLISCFRDVRDAT